MVVLGIGVGALLLVDHHRRHHRARSVAAPAWPGASVYMCQIAGGAIGLGLNTAIVVSASSLIAGINIAFLVDAILALCGLAVAVLFVGGKVDREPHPSLRHRHHRAHG